jgi:hypothetical protein
VPVDSESRFHCQTARQHISTETLQLDVDTRGGGHGPMLRAPHTRCTFAKRPMDLLMRAVISASQLADVSTIPPKTRKRAHSAPHHLTAAHSPVADHHDIHQRHCSPNFQVLNPTRSGSTAGPYCLRTIGSLLKRQADSRGEDRQLHPTLPQPTVAGPQLTQSVSQFGAPSPHPFVKQATCNEVSAELRGYT